MSESVNLPALGESVTEGTVTRWLKNVGDQVEVDEPLLEVSTDKVDTEIPSPVSGVLEEILVQEDETVEVGAELAKVGDGSGGGSSDSGDEGATEDEAETPAEDDAAEPEEPTEETEASTEEEAEEAAAERSEPSEEQEAAPAPKSSSESSSQGSSSSSSSQASSSQGSSSTAAPAESSDQSAGGYVTPLVRRLAAKEGVDLASVTGTGVGGRIRKEDVLKAAEQRPAGGSAAAAAPSSSSWTPLPTSELRGTSQKMSRLRKVVAERAVESLQTSAQLTTVVEVDVTKVAQLRAQVKDEFQQKTGTKLSFLPFFALAATEALKAYPVINATVDGDSIVYPDTENLSIAVDTERGLLTPVVRGAGDLDIAGLAKEIADLAERTRDNKVKPDELSGGTFTLTNTGSRGALFDTPLVFLPQVAILGTGIVQKKPVVVQADGAEAIAIRSTVFLALSYDHRIVDGADAARFLVAVKGRLESGDFRGSLGI